MKGNYSINTLIPYTTLVYYMYMLTFKTQFVNRLFDACRAINRDFIPHFKKNLKNFKNIFLP